MFNNILNNKKRLVQITKINNNQYKKTLPQIKFL